MKTIKRMKTFILVILSVFSIVALHTNMCDAKIVDDGNTVKAIFENPAPTDERMFYVTLTKYKNSGLCYFQISNIYRATDQYYICLNRGKLIYDNNDVVIPFTFSGNMNKFSIKLTDEMKDMLLSCSSLTIQVDRLSDTRTHEFPKSQALTSQFIQECQSILQ